MILSLSIALQSVASNSTAGKYEFDNRYWPVIDMKWEMINDTWEEEL